MEKCKDFKGFEFFMKMFFICSTGELRVFGFGINMVSSFFFFTIYTISSRILFFVRVKTEIRVSFSLREEFPL